MERKSRKKTGREGQALLMVTMGIGFLLGILGLVVDVGYSYYVKQVAQAAADSGAMAAAGFASSNGVSCGATILCQTGYTCPANPNNSTDFGVACLYASANGFSHADGGTVTISSGTGTAPSAPGVSTAYWVTVTASKPQYLGFLSALGLKGGTTSARSTGGVISGSGAGGCIYAMDPALSGAFTIVGTATVNSNCGVYVNSTALDAITAKGSSTTTASVIDVVGGTRFTNGASVTPAPTTGVTPVTDPLASLPAPAYSGCDHTSYSSSGGTITLSPGVYCGGIRITGQANLTFNPGTYILNGGGLTSTSANTSITGNGVFFYNTSNGYAFGPISIAGGASVTMTAPATGTYQGILFFQDRNITSSATNSLAGGSTTAMSGSVYMPTGDLVFVGNTTTAQTLALIVNDLSIKGTAYFQKDTVGTLTGLLQNKAFLVQ